MEANGGLATLPGRYFLYAYPILRLRCYSVRSWGGVLDLV